MFLQNPSNFSIFIVKENPHSFFSFFILCNFEFYPMNVLVYVDIDQGIYKVKFAWNEKQKKRGGFSFSINMANFEVFRQNKKFSQTSFFWKVEDVKSVKWINANIDFNYCLFWKHFPTLFNFLRICMTLPYIHNVCVRDDETAYATYDKENFVSTVKPKTCQVSASHAPA